LVNRGLELAAAVPVGLLCTLALVNRARKVPLAFRSSADNQDGH
jgi:hypothetical protein